MQEGPLRRTLFASGGCKFDSPPGGG